MATNTKTALARTGSKPAPSSTPKPAPKAAPSPAQQAARERFALARQSSAAPTARLRAASMVPRERVEKETLGKIIGSEAPTLIAGAALGAANASDMGQGFKEKFGFDISRAAGVAAMGAKLLNVDNVAGPAVGKGINSVIRSELNDLARTGGAGLMGKVSKELGSRKAETKTEEKVETKTEGTSKPTNDDKTITVKDVTHANGVNGVSQTTANKGEKNPSTSANA